MKPIQSKNRLITVPYDKTYRAWVMGPALHPGPRADAEELNSAHEARLTKSSAKAQAWADRAEKWVEARMYRGLAA